MKKTIKDIVDCIERGDLEISHSNKLIKNTDYKELINEYNIEDKNIIFKKQSIQIKTEEYLIEIIEDADKYKISLLESYIPLLDFNIIDEKEEHIIYQEVQKIHHTRDDFIDGDISERIEEFKYYHLQVMDLNNLDKDEWSVDDDIVDDIIDEIREKGLLTMPKMLISEKSSIIDGTHRLNALLKIGITKYPCYVGSNISLENLKIKNNKKIKEKIKTHKPKR